MSNTLRILLTDDLRRFIDENCGAGTPYATPGEFVCDLLRQRKAKRDAAAARDSILAGYRDLIENRTVTFDGDLRKLLKPSRS